MAHKGGKIAKVARDEIEREIGESVVTKNNKLDYEYDEKNLLNDSSNK